MVVFNNAMAGAAGSGGALADFAAIERSLRFSSGDSAYLSRTPASAGNRRTWTWSGWVKRAALAGNHYLFDATSTGTNEHYIRLNTGYALQVGGDTSSYYQVTTNQLFRDPSAWYHIVVAMDTTQATDSDRIKVYVNGSQVTFSSSTWPGLNAEGGVNSANEHNIGRYVGGTSRFFDGYLADVHFIDGQALTADDFGRLDDNNVWQPTVFGGSHGTNGFHLPFSDNSTAAALGTDTSANGNDWTVNNISVGGAQYSSTLTATSAHPSGNPASYGFDGVPSSSNANTFLANSGGACVWDASSYGFTNVEVEVYVFGVGGTLRKWQVNSGTEVNEASSAGWQNLGTFSTLSEIRCNGYGGYGGAISAIRLNGSIIVDGSDNDNDSLLDSPTNGDPSVDTGLGGELSGNYATLNPLDHNTGSSTFSQGNLKIVTPNNIGGVYVSTIATPTTGKWYAEATMVVLSQNIYSRVGLVQVGQSRNTNQLGNDTGQIAYRVEVGDIRYNLTTLATGGSAASAGDIIGIALDQDNQTLKIYKNGVLQATASNIPQFNWLFAGSDDYISFSATHEWNFGQRPFAHPVSGYKSLCTANLPTPDIADGSTAMDVVTYLGDGNSTKTVSSLSFNPDFVWLKDRDNQGGDWSHRLHNSVVGAGLSLSSNSTAGDRDSSAQAGGGLETFVTGGFTLEAGTSNNDNANKLNAPYVAWAWDGGTAFSNSAGTNGATIASSGYANQDAGFSIVSWTGNRSNSTVNHGLNADLKFLVVKNRDQATNWMVWHEAISGSEYMSLNTAGGAATASTVWNSTIPTSSVFSLGADTESNGNTDKMIAYCWAPVDGYSAFGSFDGSSSTQFIYTGFLPKYLVVKCYAGSSTQEWIIKDTARNPYNAADYYLIAESSGTEGFGRDCDFLSNGFSIPGNAGPMNYPGRSFIYFAFAEHPLRHSRAR